MMYSSNVLNEGISSGQLKWSTLVLVTLARLQWKGERGGMSSHMNLTTYIDDATRVVTLLGHVFCLHWCCKAGHGLQSACVRACFLARARTLISVAVHIFTGSMLG